MNNKHQPPPCFLFFLLPKTNPFLKTKSSSEKFFFNTTDLFFFDWLTCCIPCPIPTIPRLIPTSITPFHLGNSRVLIIIPIRFQKPPRLKRHHRKRSRAKTFPAPAPKCKNLQSNVTNYRACHKNNNSNSNVTKYYYCFCTSETFLLNAIPNPFRIHSESYSESYSESHFMQENV